jgi:cell division protease FtsH
MVTENKTAANVYTPAPVDVMGPLELAVFKSDWMSSRIYRRHVAEDAAQRKIQAVGGTVQDGIAGSAGPKSDPSQPSGGRNPAASGFAGRRWPNRDVDEEDDRPAERDVEAPTPGRIAARLLLARLFDRNPAVMKSFLSAAPVVVVEVPDRALHSRIAHQWKNALSLEHLRFVDIARMSDGIRREDYDAIEAVFNDPLPPKDRPAADNRAFAAVQLALPVLAITPAAESHLSKVLADAATHRLTLPPIDAALIGRVVRIVTGGRCTAALPEEAVAQIGLHELLLAVRFDRTADECVGNLLRMARGKTAKAGARDLSLDQLHGLDEAVEWARSVMLDLEAWKRGDIAWDAIDAGVVLDGPPGTGKTLFAKLASESFGIPMVAATLAKWQGSGEGHLGHLLRAMKKDFDEARAKAPAVFFIDELDSFPDRATVTHSHRDYVVEVVNSFIEQVDGLQGRQGLIFIGASNDVSRCDPAIVRAGRLNRIIRVRLPSPADIEKMMRVRLRGDLQDESIEEISLLAIGSTGADVERIVKDARRYARQQERALAVSDLRRAVLGRHDDLSGEMLERAATHEAGHIVVAVIHGGPEDIHAVVAGGAGSAGFVAAKNREPEAGTLEEYRKVLQALLAGRAAEEILCGAAGDGCGGSRSSDLAIATRTAAALVGSFGHAGPHPLLFVAEHHHTDAIMDHAYLRAAAHQELAAAFEEAKRILDEHREALEEVALWLRSRGRIDGFQVAEILKRSGAVEVSPQRAGGPL